MAEDRAGRGNRVSGYLHEVRSEMRKVTWPTKGELYGATFVVLAVTLAFAAALGLGDSAIGWLVETIMTAR